MFISNQVSQTRCRLKLCVLYSIYSGYKESTLNLHNLMNSIRIKSKRLKKKILIVCCSLCRSISKCSTPFWNSIKKRMIAPIATKLFHWNGRLWAANKIQQTSITRTDARIWINHPFLSLSQNKTVELIQGDWRLKRNAQTTWIA